MNRDGKTEILAVCYRRVEGLDYVEAIRQGPDLNSLLYR